MTTTRIENGYKLEYKGYVRFTCKYNIGWIMYDDSDFCNGGGFAYDTLKDQKNSMIYLIDNGYDLGKKIY